MSLIKVAQLEEISPLLATQGGEICKVIYLLPIISLHLDFQKLVINVSLVLTNILSNGFIVYIRYFVLY